MNIHILGPSCIIPYIYLKYKDDKKNNKFIVFSESHYTFLILSSFNVIKATYNPNRIYNPLEIIKGITFFIKHIVSDKEITNIHIYNVSYSMLTFFLLKLFSSTHRITINLTNDYDRDKSIDSSKKWLFRIFGLDTEIVPYGDTWYPRLTHSYILTHFNVEMIPEQEISFDGFLSTGYQIDVDTIFVLDDLVSIGLVDEYEFTLFIDEVTTLLSDNGYVLKKWHPETKRMFGNNFKCINFPKSIPFELMLNDKIKNVVGINSTCLIYSAKKGVNTLSLIDCIDYSDKENVKKWLSEQSENKIKFISDLDDLGDMLNV